MCRLSKVSRSFNLQETLRAFLALYRVKFTFLHIAFEIDRNENKTDTEIYFNFQLLSVYTSHCSKMFYSKNKTCV